jgi:hypothetical protein
MIKINNIKEPICNLYDSNNNFIGHITSNVQLNDIRIQIKKAKIKGYYIIWNKKQMLIASNGGLDWWPKGFYDLIDTQTKELLDWK